MKPQLPAMAVVTPCNRRGRQRRIPEYLGIEMGVNVDKPGRHQPSRGVDRDISGRIDTADRHYTGAFNTDVSSAPDGPRAIDHFAVSNHNVQHGIRLQESVQFDYHLITMPGLLSTSVYPCRSECFATL